MREKAVKAGTTLHEKNMEVMKRVQVTKLGKKNAAEEETTA